MRVEVLGEGDPSVAVVGAVHGDEPCGSNAVEHLRRAELAVREPVALVTANEEALERGVRYVDEDLNRAFPPLGTDPGEFAFTNTHEGRLARRLYDYLEDKLSLAIHSTQSHPEPFAVVVEPTPRQLDVCARLPVDIVVDSGALPDGRLLEQRDTIEVEAGYQGSQAATDNAIEISMAFMAATGVLDGPAEPSEKTYYRVRRPIPKPRAGKYDVFVRNFDPVEAGEAFAAIEGELMYAEQDFYPLLVSAYGYENLFGYEAERAGVLLPDGRVREDAPDEGVGGRDAGVEPRKEGTDGTHVD